MKWKCKYNKGNLHSSIIFIGMNIEEVYNKIKRKRNTKLKRSESGKKTCFLYEYEEVSLSNQIKDFVFHLKGTEW